MSITERVRDQYELYPYPPRDPEDERKRLVHTNQETIEVICHYCFKGHNPFEKGVDILIAGGGTGDSAIYLAEQLRETPSRVWYLDLSERACQIARRRAELRGLENIEWRIGSILDLPKLFSGRFEFVNCTGVLHHLEDPRLGLKVLADSLTPDGAMHVMVYGLYGRAEFYRIQELAKRAIRQPKLRHRLSALRRLLSSLPEDHPYRAYAGEVDSGLVDAFLHVQDRAYTIPELREFLDSAGLHLITFAPGVRHLYDPRAYLPDWDNAKRNPWDNWAIGELLACNIGQHAFLASRSSDTEADPADSSLVPVIPLQVGNPEMFKRQPERGRWILRSNRLPDLTIRPSRKAREALQAIDGQRSIAELAPEPKVRRELLKLIQKMLDWGDVIVFKKREGNGCRDTTEAR